MFVSTELFRVKRWNDKHWKAEGLDFKNLFFKPENWEGEDNFNSEGQDHDIYEILDR